MPFIFADDLDEPIVSDGFPSFDGGMVSAPAPKLLQQNQYAYGENLTIDTEGRICTRQGVQTYFADFTTDPVTGQHPPSYVWSVTVANASVLLCGLIVFYSVGNPLGIPSGWYRCFQAGPALGSANRFMLANADGLLPDINSGIVATALGLDGLYFVQPQIPLMLYKGTENGTTLSEYILPGTGVTNPPPRGNAACWHQGRLFIGGAFGAGDSLYGSNVLDVSTYNLNTGSLRVGDGDQDPIVQMSSWIDTAMVVWKKRSVWILDADPTTTPANWGTRNITRRLGLLCPNTTAAVNGDIWGLTTDGLRSIGRLFGTEQTVEIGNPLSQPIRDWINRMTKGAERAACGTYYKGRYFLSIPIDGSQSNNCLLVWRDVAGSWEGLWVAQNLNVSHMAVDNSQSPPALILALTSGSIVQWKDNTPDYAATDDTYTDYLPDAGIASTVAIPVVAKIRTRSSVMQDFLAQKRGWLLDVEFYNSKSRQVEIYAILDGGAPILIATVDSRGGTDPQVSLPTVLPWTLGSAPALRRRTIKYKPAGRFRECQFELRAVDGRYLCISNMVATAFIETIKVQQ